MRLPVTPLHQMSGSRGFSPISTASDWLLIRNMTPVRNGPPPFAGKQLGMPSPAEGAPGPANYYCHISRLFIAAGLIGYSEPIRSGKQVRTVAW